MKLMQHKVVIITGAGRERGQGRAAALKFAEHGARVVVTDLARNDEECANIERVASAVREQGVESLALAVDVTDRDQVNACVDKTIATQMADESTRKLAQWHGISLEQAWKEAERCALGRSAQAEEVADAMLYLGSNMSSYVSGQALLVCGGANPGL